MDYSVPASAPRVASSADRIAGCSAAGTWGESGRSCTAPTGQSLGDDAREAHPQIRGAENDPQEPEMHRLPEQPLTPSGTP